MSDAAISLLVLATGIVPPMLGAPLVALFFAVAVLVVPRVWPF